jgi:hypothetical protein
MTQAITVREWDEANADAMTGRNDMPALLFDLYAAGRIDPTILRAVLPGVWVGAEWPEACVPRRTWISWFRLAAFAPPPAPVTIYRGSIPRFARGMAWTSDPEKAAWFARRWAVLRHPRVAHVYTVAAPPEAILADMDALFEGRAEAEIVVDPALLPPLRRLP